MPSGRWLHGQAAAKSARFVADAFSRDKAATPADFLGEEDTLLRVQLYVVLCAQLEKQPDGFEQVIHGGVNHDVVQLDQDVYHQVFRDDTRQIRL